MTREYDFVSLGEAMMRLSPPNHQRLEQTTSLEVRVGGAELNVAVAGARLGLRAAWLSKLPDTPLGRMVANKARGPDLREDGCGRGFFTCEFCLHRAAPAGASLRPGVWQRSFGRLWRNWDGALWNAEVLR